MWKAVAVKNLPLPVSGRFEEKEANLPIGGLWNRLLFIPMENQKKKTGMAKQSGLKMSFRLWFTIYDTSTGTNLLECFYIYD